MNDKSKNRQWVSMLILLGIASIAFAAYAKAAVTQRGDPPAPPHNPTASDVIETPEGDLTITPISHASLMLEIAGRTVYVDPVGDFSQMQDHRADVVLVTDIHGDHLNADSVRSIAKVGAVVVVPPEVSRTLNTAIVYENGESSPIILPNITLGVEAVPAYNLTRGPSEGEFYHPKGRGQGYIITMGDKRIFVSGDTECVPEIRELENIDVAFLPMNLPFTMTPEEAAECATAFRPSIVYPYHYRGQDPQVFADALSGETDIEVRLRDWY